VAEAFVHSFEWDPVKTRSNLAKHGVEFAHAASVLADPLALTVFDAARSPNKQRWFTLGMSSTGVLLALAHTFEPTGPASARPTRTIPDEVLNDE